MLRNEYAEATDGIPGQTIWRLPPPMRFDRDDPVIEIATQMRQRVVDYSQTYMAAVRAGEWPRDSDHELDVTAFWEFWNDIVKDNERCRLRRAYYLDKAYCRSNSEPWLVLPSIPPHPGKDCPYPITRYTEESLVAHHPEFKPSDTDTALVAHARELAVEVLQLLKYFSLRWCDYEWIRCHVFFGHLSDVASETKRVAARLSALIARIQAKHLSLVNNLPPEDQPQE